MTFRTSGTAWDGQPWHLAPALVTFVHQIEAIRPGTHPADGTVAGKGHDAGNPNSDHTVWPKTGPGVVYAADVGETQPALIDEWWDRIRISRDSRCKYAIHDTRMFSSYPVSGYAAFTWRPYRGPNPHKSHGHLSVHHDNAEDPRAWALLPVQSGDDMAIDKDLLVARITDAQIDALFGSGAVAGDANYFKLPAPQGIRNVPSNPDWDNFVSAMTVAAWVKAATG